MRLRRVYRVARRTARPPSPVALGTLSAAVPDAVRVVGWPSRCGSSEPPRQADAIVVFAGGVGESGEAGGGYQERVKQAVDLYKAGYAPRLIFSSGFRVRLPGSRSHAARSPWRTACRPTRSCSRRRPANTYENVTRSRADSRRPRLAQRPARQLAVSHAARDADLAEERARVRGRSPSPVPVEPVLRRTAAAPSIEQMRGILQEYAAIALYWWRGWI